MNILARVRQRYDHAASVTDRTDRSAPSVGSVSPEMAGIASLPSLPTHLRIRLYGLALRWKMGDGLHRRLLLDARHHPSKWLCAVVRDEQMPTHVRAGRLPSG